ncbi:sulfurtransferase TusA family protein [Marinobacter alexandrii]|uniref:sulfurtransferase TusA family protein n=1 Tax=Marinobacter alexandrii TaxID=2570351 RepID=UPI003298FDD1
MGDIVEVDAQGLDCPMPLLMAKRALNAVGAGDCIRIVCTDQGSIRDFDVFCVQSGHIMVESNAEDGIYTYLLKKTA